MLICIQRHRHEFERELLIQPAETKRGKHSERLDSGGRRCHRQAGRRVDKERYCPRSAEQDEITQRDILSSISDQFSMCVCVLGGVLRVFSAAELALQQTLPPLSCTVCVCYAFSQCGWVIVVARWNKVGLCCQKQRETLLEKLGRPHSLAHGLCNGLLWLLHKVRQRRTMLASVSMFIPVFLCDGDISVFDMLTCRLHGERISGTLWFTRCPPVALLGDFGGFIFIVCWFNNCLKPNAPIGWIYSHCWLLVYGHATINANHVVFASCHGNTTRQ